jgi:hypothetical protein
LKIKVFMKFKPLLSKNKILNFLNFNEKRNFKATK